MPKVPREERVFNNLLKVTEQLIQGKNYKPMSEGELIQKLSLPSQHYELFCKVIQALLQQNFIELVNGKYRLKEKSQNIGIGVIRMHPRGFGFVQLNDQSKYSEDIFIPKPFTKNSVDGDIVEVEVNKEVTEKGPEGKVLAILSRSRTHITGIIKEINTYGDIVAYAPLLGSEKRIIVQTNRSQPLQVGDRLLMEVISWGEKEEDTLCKFFQYIGHISDPSCDVKAAIIDHELREEFPEKAVEDARRHGKKVQTSEIMKREDLRKLECFTIDPDTAKDFDDAISLSVDKNGYHLGVHIADVSHYVQRGTILDEEARLRCNSTYFPGVCIPMLPSELSDNLCSLKANVNRLTVSVFVKFDREGNTLDYRIVRSTIKSVKRFTYKEAKAVIDGKRKSPLRNTLLHMVDLCALLKKKRYERGSIEFALPELVVLVDKNGVPYGTDYVEYDISHQLVEEFMLKANEIVATHLSKMGKNLTFRIHEEPSEENMRDFAVLAGAFGFNVSKKPTPVELQKLFDEALQTPYGPYLATSYIRRMRLAIYSPDNIGHYGLSLAHYCHFTSPIRRYVDLVAHRIIFGESDDRKELDYISSLASEKERISARAESSVLQLKKLRMLEKMYQNDPQQQYEAVITRVKGFGLYFEVVNLMLEGFLHISELGNDYYIFEESSMRIRGRNTGIFFAAGDKINVMLKNVDLILADTEWNFVSDTIEHKNKKPVSQKREKKKKSEKKNKARKRK